jgi:hypothetical protein
MKCLDLNINYDDGMRDLYNFRLKKDFTEINPINEDYRSMIFKFKMQSISLSCYFLNEFLAEIVCQDMVIEIDKYVSFMNKIDISSTAIWAFGEEDEDTGHKQVIIGPSGCLNSVFTDASFYSFDTNNHVALKNLDFEGSIKAMNTFIKMHNGEKEITTELDQLKMFLKLHIFMLLFHFFTEGLPKYDIDDADLPNECKCKLINL